MVADGTYYINESDVKRFWPGASTFPSDETISQTDCDAAMLDVYNLVNSCIPATTKQTDTYGLLKRASMKIFKYFNDNGYVDEDALGKVDRQRIRDKHGTIPFGTHVPSDYPPNENQ